MDISGRLYTATVTLLETSLFVGFFCYLLPRLILGADLSLFALKSGVFLFIGLVPIILGIVTMIGFVWGFILAGTGSPVLYHMPEELIVRGSYRFVRNPMYVGHCLLIFGQAVLFKSFGFLLYLLVFFLMLHVLVVFVEEPMLKREFGESYEQYCKSVPRWIPRLRPFRVDISKSS
jgi:protein-S-isoprenylcysteine O-methyltransferase Ste14